MKLARRITALLIPAGGAVCMSATETTTVVDQDMMQATSKKPTLLCLQTSTIRNRVQDARGNIAHSTVITVRVAVPSVKTGGQ